MPKIRIETDPKPPGRAIIGNNAKVFIDGKELKGVMSVDVHYDPNSAITADMKLLAHEAMNLEAEMMVNVSMFCMTGFRVVENWESPSRRVYTVERIIDKPSTVGVESPGPSNPAEKS